MTSFRVYRVYIQEESPITSGDIQEAVEEMNDEYNGDYTAFVDSHIEHDEVDL